MRSSLKKIFFNFTSLSFLQISNFIFPLITFPYLVRVLGPEKFGLVNFATAFVGYFGIITDYGFNLSATREISINRDNNNKINEIVNSVLIIKILLFIISSLILGAVIYWIPFFHQNSDVYIISFLAIFGQALFPLWFFQGIEEMKYITIVNVAAKAIVVLFIFLLVTGTEDYRILIMLYSSGVILTGILGLVIVKTKYDVKFFIPDSSSIIHQLKDGGHLFIFSLATSLYSISNTFILGLFAGNTIVGYFVAADKIRQAVMNIISTISQSVYPYLNKVFNSSIPKGLEIIKKLFGFVGLLSLGLSLILFIWAEQIVMIVLGSEYSTSVNVLKIISWLIFLVGLSNVLGIQTMLNLNFKKSFLRIIILASIISLGLSFILVPVYFEIGTSVSVLITELFVTIGMIAFFYNKREYIKRVSDV